MADMPWCIGKWPTTGTIPGDPTICGATASRSCPSVIRRGSRISIRGAWTAHGCNLGSSRTLSTRLSSYAPRRDTLRMSNSPTFPTRRCHPAHCRHDCSSLHTDHKAIIEAEKDRVRESRTRHRSGTRTALGQRNRRPLQPRIRSPADARHVWASCPTAFNTAEYEPLRICCKFSHRIHRPVGPRLRSLSPNWMQAGHARPIFRGRIRWTDL